MSRFFESNPVAIVGMACRLPGAKNLEAYWDLLKNGRSAVAELPAERLNRELYYDPKVGVLGKTYTTLGALAAEVPVDPSKLGLAPEVAAAADPAYLTLCDVAAEALRHAKLDPLQLPSRNAGVYIGSAAGAAHASRRVFATLIEETAAYLRDLPAWKQIGDPARRAKLVEDAIAEVVAEVRRQNNLILPTDPVLGAGAHTAAGLIARAFGLRGPYMAVEAACASSLQALLLGVHALQQGRLDFAVVGGVSYCRADKFVLFSKAQSVSATGTRPFDEAADGLIIAEGYVAMILKTLPRALEDGDPIHAVIRGAGMSTDGRGKSLWAPRHEGQMAAMQRAYSRGADISRVQYIEAHATSTQVGDATELNALRETIGGKLPPGRRVALGSSKSNFGHALEAAGIVGLVKTVLALQHRQIPPSINITKLNTSVDWERAPFFVARELLPWPENDGQPRRAGVNAFGVGGLNVHLVIDEYVPEQPRSFYLAAPRQEDLPAAQEAIAVIGLGVILPGARTVEQFWEQLVSGVDPKSEVPPERWSKELGFQPGAPAPWKTTNCLGGFIRDYQYDWRKNKVPPKQVEQANPLQFMLLDAADQALRDAGYDRRAFDRNRMGVVVGSIFTGDFQNQMQMGLRLPEFNVILRKVLRDQEVPASLIDDVIAEYREALLLKLPALMDETGSFTSSTLASRITKTYDLMGGAFAVDASGGGALAALSCAVDILRSGECDLMFCAAGQRSMDLFAFNALAQSGALAAGQPASALDAAASGFVPGEGGGVLLFKRLSDAQRDGDVIRAVVRGVGVCTNFENPAQTSPTALRQFTQAERRQLGAIELAAGAPRATWAEVDAVAEVIRSDPPARAVRLGTLSGQYGYSGAASAMTSVVKAVLTLEKQLLPGGMKVGNATPSVLRHQKLFSLPTQSESFGSDESGEKQFIGVSSGLAAGQTFFTLLEKGATTSANPILETTLLSPRPRVAWMFVGQGSQYSGMLRPLVSEFSPAAAAMERANRALSTSASGTFAELAWDNPTGLGTDPSKTQLAMLVADYIFAESLFALGALPSVVAGHSFGELPALLAAGVWSLETTIRCIRARSDALALASEVPGGMVAVTAGRDVVEQLTSEASKAGRIHVANHNAPSQFVLSGEVPALERVLELAKQANVNAIRLVVPCAYHSPLMTPALPRFAAALPDFPMRNARVPVLSTILNRYLIEAEDLRAGLLEHFTRPVPYVDMVRKLASDHPTVFIEVGPQRVLTKLHQKILAGENCRAISSDDAKQPGLQQLKSVLSYLRSCGALDGSPVEIKSGAAGRLIHFDATERRRQKRRELAADGMMPARLPTAPASDTAVNVERGPEAGMEALRKFMVQFIVEQTGYPETMVELDANLEADLGIDSIKKAQLFGEIRENFHVDPPSGGVTLDDFPTLRHVLAFLEKTGVSKMPVNDAGSAASAPVQSNTLQGAPGSLQREMQRFVPRLVAAPLRPDFKVRQWSGRAAVLGDNVDAVALCGQLQQRGLQVVSLSNDSEPAEAVQQLARAWNQGPIAHLFVMTARDGAPMLWADEGSWRTRHRRGVLVPFAVCQKWYELITASEVKFQPTLVAATALGGDLGFSGDLTSAEGGGLAGLIKAIAAESGGAVTCRVLDFPAGLASAHLAKILVDEVSVIVPEKEIAYSAKGDRCAVTMQPQVAQSLARREVPGNGTWVVTGGGRGVTAFVARELANKYQLQLHLLASRARMEMDPRWKELTADELKSFKTQLAQAVRGEGESLAAARERAERALELEQTLQRCAELGVKTTYHQCDVADRARLTEVLAEIRNVSGPIEGVIHGAGVEHACKFSAKKLETVSRTIAAKVDGAAALMAALDSQPPRFFIGFGSVSGRFGGVGQTDYSLANDMLAKLMAQFRRRHPECAATCIAWSAWDEIGMAARPESKFALQAMKVSFMSPAEGLEHLVDELQAQGADAEVVITDQPFSHAPALPAVVQRIEPLPAPSDTQQTLTPAVELDETARQFGEQHRAEIQSWLREYADRVAFPNAASAPQVPEVMRPVMEARNEAELRGFAAGAGVALVSLLAHSRQLRQPTSDVLPTEAFPLIDFARVTQPGLRLTAQTVLHPRTDVFLLEHKILDRPVLPGAVSLEILAQAACLLQPQRTLIGLANLELRVRYDCKDEEPSPLEVEVEARGPAVVCKLVVPVKVSSRSKPVVLATAEALFGDKLPMSQMIPWNHATGAWHPFTYSDDWRVVYHGPNFRTLEAVCFSNGGGQANLRAKSPLGLAGTRRGSNWLVPSALLDGCLVACGTYSFLAQGERVEVPLRIGQLKLYRQPRENELCRLELVWRGSDKQGSTYDFQLAGEDGQAVLTVSDYRTACLKQGKAKP